MSTYEEIKKKYEELNDEDLDAALGGSRIITNTRFIVDGVKINSIANIDSENIESIELINEPAGAAKYGVYGALSAFLITTMDKR